MDLKLTARAFRVIAVLDPKDLIGVVVPNGESRVSLKPAAPGRQLTTTVNAKNIVWGNLGDDTLAGGDGIDQVRGGQGDDVLNAGAGDDYVSGDRGNDTIAGAEGTDEIFGGQPLLNVVGSDPGG